MPYCPICNLHGVSEDHALRFHGVNNFHNANSTDEKITTCDFSDPYTVDNFQKDREIKIKDNNCI